MKGASLSLKRFYNEASLSLIKHSAIDAGLTDDQFAKFQREHLQGTLAPFEYDLCTTSMIETDGSTGAMQVDPHLLGFNASASDVLSSYMKVAPYDTVSQMVYANPGRTFLYTDLWDGPPEDHIFFREHCQRYGIHKAISIGFALRFADEYFVAFDFMAGPKKPNWYEIDPAVIEYAAFPFALAWLCRKKRVGKRALNTHFKALSGLTGGQLAKLRRYMNRRQNEDLSAQARALGLKLSGYDGPLYDVRDRILTKFGLDIEQLKSQGQLRLEAMEPYCELLKMMGDQTAPIAVPPNINLTQSFMQRMAKKDSAPKLVPYSV